MIFDFYPLNAKILNFDTLNTANSPHQPTLQLLYCLKTPNNVSAEFMERKPKQSPSQFQALCATA